MLVKSRRLCGANFDPSTRSEEHTSELQSREKLVCRLLLEKKKSVTTTSSTVRPEGKLSSTVCTKSGRFSGVRFWKNGSVFFFNDTATTEIYTLSLHDALPTWT